MDKKLISVLTWEEALELLTPDYRSSDFCKLITIICNELKPSNKNYVYYTKFEFGEKLIDRGRFPLEDFSVRYSTDFKKTNLDLKEDLSYSNDPLGMVVNNHIEVYSENILLNNKSQPVDSYTVPLNLIKEGGLFGLFGTLDFLSHKKTENTKSNENINSIGHDWHAVAGNICFEIAFPFDNNIDFEYINNKDWAVKFRKKYDQLSYIGEHKISFVRDYLYSKNNNDNNKWSADVIYFPRHIFEISSIQLSNLLELHLYKSGWIQSSPLRYILFENKIIADVLYQLTTIPDQDKHFLNILYDYITKASLGKSYVLKPLTSPSHILNTVLGDFKKDLGGYLKKSKHYEPLIFVYDKMNSNGDWGIISTKKLPLLFNYNIEKLKLNVLYDSLLIIKKEVEKQPLNFIPFPDTIITTDKGSGTDRIDGRNYLKSLLSSTFSVDDKHICLSSEYFSDLILIKSK